MITLQVKRIPNKGVHGEYPALRNIQTGRIYVDTCLGQARWLAADDNGRNIHGDFVGFNIPGAWHSWCGEPECPLRQNVSFVLEGAA